MSAISAPASSLNIVLVIDSLAGGGAEKVVLELARAITEIGHKAIIVSLTGYAVYDVPPDIPVYFLYQQKKTRLHSKKYRLAHARALRQLMKRVDADHGGVDFIFSNLDYSHYIVSVCEFPHAAYVVHNAVSETLSRARKMGPFKWWRQRRLFASLQQQPCIAVSDGLKQELLNHPLISPASVIRIYNPFNFTRIRELADEPCDQIPDGPYLIHVGRFARQKRHDLLFKALSLLPESVPLVCLGANERAIKSLAAKYNLSERVIVPGFQQNPYSWIHHAACLVLSSDYEGFGNVLVEALACQTPVVATDCPYGPNEILLHEQAENLIPRNDPEAMAVAVARILAQPQKNLVEESLLRFDHHTIAWHYVNYAMTHRIENRNQVS